MEGDRTVALDVVHSCYLFPKTFSHSHLMLGSPAASRQPAGRDGTTKYQVGAWPSASHVGVQYGSMLNSIYVRGARQQQLHR